MAFTFCGVELPNPFFLAPMAGVTNRSFRTIALEMGAGLVFTEMVSAAGLARGDRKTVRLLPSPAEAPRVGVQLFGGRPEDMRAATLVVNTLAVPFIDVNFGCPARKIVRAGCGVAIMREPARVRAILTAVCSVATKPVLAKIRAGWDDNERNAVEIARIARDCGVAAVTVHGRTGRQCFTGLADWGVIREVAADGALPVVGNGDLVTPQRAVQALRDAGCAAVMIGRGAYGNPWIFREAAALLAGTSIAGTRRRRTGPRDGPPPRALDRGVRPAPRRAHDAPPPHLVRPRARRRARIPPAGRAARGSGRGLARDRRVSRGRLRRACGRGLKPTEAPRTVAGAPAARPSYRIDRISGV